ncbi:MAG: hypothetical protein Q4F71_00550 [Paracoccus sp. (in: a-proteobacteria)]|nr:hypothetical protein [Paracoccus sp. (in: a-proteobacteria)]
MPDGVIQRDAREIYDPGYIVKHRKTGSPALHSDLFKYAMLAKIEMLWVDLDIIALKPFSFPSPWVFGYEGPDAVNGAVLGMPRESAALAALLEFKHDTIGLPQYLSGTRRLKYLLRSLGRGLPINRWPWVAVGPRALTYYLQMTGEISHTLPQSAFYHVPLENARLLVAPDAVSRESLPPEAWAVHLWGKKLRTVIAEEFGGTIPTGSFLANEMESVR